MSHREATATLEQGHGDETQDEHGLHGSAKEIGEHHHPGNGEYVRIALILGVLTALEVALFYLEEGGVLVKGFTVPALIVLSSIKFAIVALFFMHLKFDSPVFSFMFGGGVVMAIGAFLAMLFMFRVL